MSRVLLDTDILSDVIKRKDAIVVARATEYLAVEGRFTISTITVMEVVYGLRRVGAAARLANFEESLRGAEVIDFDEPASVLAGRIYADLERAGRPVGVPDVMIAAVALRHGLPVVTGNVDHFAAIREVGHALAIENWRVRTS